MTTTLAATQPTVRYHPIRGAAYGLFFGLGLALVLMVFKVLALSVPMLFVLALLFLVLGGVWGRVCAATRCEEPAAGPIDDHGNATDDDARRTYAAATTGDAQRLTKVSPSTRRACEWCDGRGRCRPWE
ncbi:MAG: hypothetical protein ABIQ73_23960 [Acidimicrobiales bacterium]